MNFVPTYIVISSLTSDSQYFGSDTPNFKSFLQNASKITKLDLLQGMIGDTEMSVLIYDACTLRRMEMLRARGLCGIRRCEDKGSVVR